MDDKIKTPIDTIETYFHIKTTDKDGKDIAKVQKNPIYIDYNNIFFERINGIDAVAFRLDLKLFSKVIWNHIKLPDDDNFSIPKLLHPGTRILVVGYFDATEATINDTFFIDGRLQEGMSGSPIFIYTSDLENRSCGYQGLHSLQFIGMVSEYCQNLEVFPIVSLKNIQQLVNSAITKNI